MVRRYAVTVAKFRYKIKFRETFLLRGFLIKITAKLDLFIAPFKPPLTFDYEWI